MLLALLQNEPEGDSPVKGGRKTGWECVKKKYRDRLQVRVRAVD